MLFVFIGGILLGPICFLFQHLYRQTLDAPAFYLGKDVTTLVVGDSHTQGAIDPAWLIHSENISKSAENYFFTYYKLKHFLNKNSQINLVIMGFSWHNFAKKYEESFLFGKDNNVTSVYYPLLDQQGKSILWSWENTYLYPYGQYTLGLPLKIYDQRLLQRKLFSLKLNRDDFEFFGGYEKLTSSNTNNILIENKLNKYFYHPTSSSGSDISAYMTQYLEKILNLCEERKIKIILINTPVYDVYRSGIPDDMVRVLDSIQIEMQSRHPNLIFIDYSKLKLDRNNYYDGDHVNQFGAEIVTKRLAETVLTKN